MFRTPYINQQEDYIVHAALYGMISCIYKSSLAVLQTATQYST
jgi:hypothetical protein